MNLYTLTSKSPIKLVIVSVVIVSLMSCKRNEPRHNEISKIEVATGYCFGACQFTAISIDSQLNLNYYGGQLLPGKPRKVLKGNFNGRFTQRLWDTLNSKLERINYKLLDTSYQNSYDDQSLEIVIYHGNKTKHIRAQSVSLPDSVRKVFYWITDAYKLVPLQPAKNPFKFSTTTQYPIQPPTH